MGEAAHDGIAEADGFLGGASACGGVGCGFSGHGCLCSIKRVGLEESRAIYYGWIDIRC